MLNLHHLRVFYLTAKHLSYTKAAKQLFVTQPAITSQLKRFEDWCELKLFKKRGRNIYLTEEGRLLYEQVKGIFDWEGRVEGLIEELKGLKKGVLRSDNPDVEFIPFSQEELVTIVPPFHPLARKGEAEVEDLAREPLIMKEQGSGTRKKVEALFSQHDLIPNILMETSNAEFIKQLVARGEGISFLVREAVGSELREGKLAAVGIRGHALSLDVSIAYLTGQHLTRAGQAFLDLLLSMIPRKEEEAGIKSIMARMLAEWK